MEMFRQIAANGTVNKTSLAQVPGKDLSSHLCGEENDVHGGEDLNHGAVDASAACPFLSEE